LRPLLAIDQIRALLYLLPIAPEMTDLSGSAT
jgi:hypothetical protein